MDEELLKQIFEELFSSLEPLETQSTALLELLKAKGIVTDEELAPFLKQAGNASDVRWRAARLRTSALIASALKPPEKPVEARTPKNTEATSGSKDETRKKETQSQESQLGETQPAKTQSEAGSEKPRAENSEESQPGETQSAETQSEAGSEKPRPANDGEKSRTKEAA
jgi:hypothetical protein